MVWWEIVFMMVILKIPIVYLCAVVWWAIKAEPDPGDGASGAEDDAPFGPCPWWHPSRRRRPGPHGAPVRRAPKAAPPVFARGKVER